MAQLDKNMSFLGSSILERQSFDAQSRCYEYREKKFDNIFNTVRSVKGKIEDNDKARKD